jgi:hypothetical protein
MRNERMRDEELEKFFEEWADELAEECPNPSCICKGLDAE